MTLGNTTVEEFDRFLKTFSTKGALTRCRVTPRFAGASSAQWQAHRQRNTRITGARGRRAGLQMTFLGTGLGDRYKVLRGGSTRFEEGVRRTEELTVMQGKRTSKRRSLTLEQKPESSMVRRGSPVRVRKRALKDLQNQAFLVVCAESRVRRGSASEARTGTFAGLSRPERLAISCL